MAAGSSRRSSDATPRLRAAWARPPNVVPRAPVPASSPMESCGGGFPPSVLMRVASAAGPQSVRPDCRTTPGNEMKAPPRARMTVRYTHRPGSPGSPDVAPRHPPTSTTARRTPDANPFDGDCAARMRPPRTGLLGRRVRMETVCPNPWAAGMRGWDYLWLAAAPDRQACRRPPAARGRRAPLTRPSTVVSVPTPPAGCPRSATRCCREPGGEPGPPETPGNAAPSSDRTCSCRPAVPGSCRSALRT